MQQLFFPGMRRVTPRPALHSEDELDRASSAYRRSRAALRPKVRPEQLTIGDSPPQSGR